MLQNKPISKLQNVNNNRIAQQNSVVPIVFPEGHIITAQPAQSHINPNKTDFQQPKIISTSPFGDPRIPGASILTPRSGLDFLHGVPSIHVEQTVSLLNDPASSENRFIVRSSTNEAIYAATEYSSYRDRVLFGSSRSFSLHILDKFHQEAVSFRRKLRLGVYLLQPEILEIWAPPGDFLGSVRERYTFLSADFVIQNASGDVIGHIRGPSRCWCCCFNSQEMFLKVLSVDGMSQIGSITRAWNTDIATFTQNVYFTNPQMDVHSKVLFMGAVFLVEYKYFQSRCC